MINVTGVAYFAITPKCVMGGGALHLGLDVGPVSAWLDVILDVFIQFDPFMYMADLAVSVGCAITIKVWFVHIRISVSVGAALHIEGPDPFRGSANVEFYLFSFTVHFGRSPTIEVEKKSLPQFYEMVKSPGPSTPAPSDSSVRDEQQALVKFTVSTGLIPPAQTAPRSDSGQFPSTGATATWLVKSGTFSCNIGFEFAISSAHIRRSNDVNTTVVELFPKEGASAIKPFWSKPMQLTSSNPISSSVEVKVWMLNLADPEKNTPIDAMQGELVTKDVPAALWGAYDRAEDPIRTGNPSATTAALSDPREPTMNLCMAINLWTLPGVLLPSPITDIDASAAFRRYLDPTWFNASPVEQKILRSSGVLYSTESPSERWAHVVTDWQNFAATGSPVLESSTLTEGEVQGSGLLKSAAKYLGWDKPSPKGAGSDNGNSTDGRKKWMLNAKPAKRMMKSLPTSYPVLFRYSAVTA
ncbi:hypothetical protein M501DRAFT_801748 [Patellaria atrata CBS 101060]|uniref:DUF6603 domain-containing protein n=1 Tax=Patellaria atrata CBS 101060 TaxID=1346257 RepID=A0A9P4VQ43_9PEZI|nr:hypothetical protein M501DRAFT_801748 [Patellaria atrata CBS 101060]